MSAAVIASSQELRKAALEVREACRGCCSGAALRAAYDAVVAEPIPPHLSAALDKLN